MKRIPYLILLFFVLINLYAFNKSESTIHQQLSDIEVKKYVDNLIDPITPDSMRLEPKVFANIRNMDYATVPELVELLYDEKYWVRISALLLINDIVNKNQEKNISFGKISIFYKDENYNIKERKKVIKQIDDWWKENMNESPVDLLIAQLKEERKSKREIAVMKMGNYKFDREDKTIIGSYKENKEVKKMIKALELSLNDKEIKNEVIISLVKLGENCYIDDLIENNLKINDEDLKHRSLEELFLATKETLGFDYAENNDSEKVYSSWKKWWEENRNKYCPQKNNK